MEIFAALVLLALFGIIAVGVTFLVTIRPLWRMADMAASETQLGRTKKLWIILSVLVLGPMMMSFYPCFRKESRILRRTTSLVWCVMVLAGVIGIGIILGLQAVISRAEQTREARSGAQRKATRTVPPLAFARRSADEVVPFTALCLVPKPPANWSVRIAEFTGYGPRPDPIVRVACPSIYPVTQIAVDPEGGVYYAITTHEVGRIDRATGRFIELAPDPATGKPSWPSAIAYDSNEHLLLITARSRGYSYKPATAQWRTVPGLEDHGVIAMAYDPIEAVLYALRTDLDGRRAVKLVKMRSNGTMIGEIVLSHPIPVGQYPFALAQLCWSGREFIVVVSSSVEHVTRAHQTPGPALYSVQPHTGLCQFVDREAPLQLERN